MRNIMFVCQSLGNGGAERVVSVLSGALSQTEDKIYILAMVSRECVYPVDERVNIILPDKQIKPGIVGKLQRIKAIRNAVINHNINVVIAFEHFNAMFSVLAVAGLNSKVIGSERNDPAQIKNRTIIHTLRTILYRRLDYLVCQTEDAKRYFPIDIQKKSAVILNPISSDLPEPYTGDREKRIVTFCRLEKQKNIPMLIDAFELLQETYPEYVLDIYGNGREKEALIRYVRTRGLENRIRIMPFCKDIHSQVLKAAVFASPSDYEGLSNSMIEAMAIGLPTIVTDCPCGGARMMIKDGENGILVPTGDRYQMYEAIKRVISDKAFANQIGQAGTKIRALLSSEVIAEQWRAIIQKIDTSY